LKSYQIEAGSGEWYVFAVNLALLAIVLRNHSEYTHSYSDCFASFDSFNSFSVDSFDFELLSTEKSETYGFAGLACSLPYPEWEES
jgi:hypothetical protein